jgi:hypothetical protein
MSDLTIHPTAGIIGEADPLLSMTALQAAAGGGRKAIIDKSGPLAKLAAKGRMACCVSADSVGQIKSRLLHKIDLSARKSWCESNDPNFAAKAAEIVGLYLAPPENAIVICVDEKPSIQALERARAI